MKQNKISENKKENKLQKRMRPKKWKKLMKAELLGQAHVAIQSIGKKQQMG